jgi:hypothetical protein
MPPVLNQNRIAGHPKTAQDEALGAHFRSTYLPFIPLEVRMSESDPDDGGGTSKMNEPIGAIGFRKP